MLTKTFEVRLMESLNTFYDWGVEEEARCKDDIARMKTLVKNLRAIIIEKLVWSGFFHRDWVDAHVAAFHAGFYGNQFDFEVAVKEVLANERQPIIEPPLGDDEPF